MLSIWRLHSRYFISGFQIRLRHYGTQIDVSGIDRIDNKLINPLKLEVAYINEIIEMATEFKNKKKSFDSLFAKKNICLMTTDQLKDMTLQLFMWKASKMMGGSVMPIYTKWADCVHKEDLGRLVALFNDLILVQGYYCKDVFQFGSGSTVPVIYLACNMQQPLEGFAHLMTFKEHYGHLENLKFAWIGPGNSTLNTYMTILPKFGINIQFNCTNDPDKPVSPMLFKKTEKLCAEKNTCLTECITPNDALKDANIIATTSHNHPSQTISLKMIETNANKNWILMHDIPRGDIEIEDDVYNHKNNLVWKNFSNLVYICMAVMQYTVTKHGGKSDVIT